MNKEDMLRNKLEGWLYNANDAQTIVDDICELFGWPLIDQDDILNRN